MKTKLIIYGALSVLVCIVLWLCSHSPVHLAMPAGTQPSSNVLSPAAAQATAPKTPVATRSPVPKMEELSVPVSVIVDKRGDYNKRAASIQAVTGKISDADRQALYSFLLEKDSTDQEQSGQTLKNELLDRLCSFCPPPRGLLELLSDIYQDRGRDEVLRDYAVQHVAEFYRQMGGAASIDPALQVTELSSARNLLWGALSETDSSIAGTALLGLSHLSQQGWTGFDQSKIGQSALSLASANNVGELTKTTAMQVCAGLGVQEALMTVMGAAQQGETESVKISAIGALGLLGGSDQIQFLNSVVTGADNRLQAPAQAALNRINARIQQTGRAKSNAG